MVKMEESLKKKKDNNPMKPETLRRNLKRQDCRVRGVVCLHWDPISDLTLAHV